MAAIYLQLKGYQILERRFKTKSGEIDIIARRKDLLIAIEVKARKSAEQAKTSITRTAQNRIAKAAHIYIRQNKPVQTLGLRFDAIFVVGFKIIHEPDFWRE